MSNKFIDAKELSVITGFNLRKASSVIQAANKRIRESGGIIVKGKAPRQMIENLLFVDLTPSEDARQACEKAPGRPRTVKDEYLIEKRGQGRF